MCFDHYWLSSSLGNFCPIDVKKKPECSEGRNQQGSPPPKKVRFYFYMFWYIDMIPGIYIRLVAWQIEFDFRRKRNIFTYSITKHSLNSFSCTFLSSTNYYFADTGIIIPATLRYKGKESTNFNRCHDITEKHTYHDKSRISCYTDTAQNNTYRINTKYVSTLRPRKMASMSQTIFSRTYPWIKPFWF